MDTKDTIIREMVFNAIKSALMDIAFSISSVYSPVL